MFVGGGERERGGDGGGGEKRGGEGGEAADHERFLSLRSTKSAN